MIQEVGREGQLDAFCVERMFVQQNTDVVDQYYVDESNLDCDVSDNSRKSGRKYDETVKTLNSAGGLGNTQTSYESGSSKTIRFPDPTPYGPGA